MNILDKLVEATKIRVSADKKQKPIFDHFPPSTPFSFENALKAKEMSFICEVKKASPSKGIIAEDFPYEQIAKDYEKAGASCISVLTEPDYFKGKDEYLTQIKQSVSIPILRKDFIIDEYQIYQAKHIGADAILLICSILDQSQMEDYLDIATDIGLSCLVEAHDEDEVEMALSAGAKIIGINNRNLKTFEVDIHNSTRLRKLVPNDILFVSESGISIRTDILELEECGVNAVLIGETLMRSPDKKAVLDQLRNA